MRTLVDKRRSGLALGLVLLAVLCFGIAWVEWSGPPESNCVQPKVSGATIRGCIAQQAHQMEPDGMALVTILAGTALLTGSIFTGARAIRRAITLSEAAQQLGLQPGEVRQLVDDGVLEIYAQEPEAIYLKPDDVNRLSII